MKNNLIQPRLNRYKDFIESQFIESLLWNKDYSLCGINPDLEKQIMSGYFKRIVFTGMGCSAIVSDVIKGFFVDQQISIFVEVINDYDIDILIDKNIIKDDRTLVIVSSYSGHSQEPIHFYHNIKYLTKNIIFITSGGRLAEIAKEDNISIIYWQLRNPDREYPLFHVPQYFSILLDIFYELNILKSNYKKELIETVSKLRAEFDEKKIIEAKQIADELYGREIVFIANPKWYVSLLKLANMHFNEMAMVPAHRNYFHEFTHSEVAVFSDPSHILSIVMFRDIDNDRYNQEKMTSFASIISEKTVKQNKNISIHEIILDKSNFSENLFSTLYFLSYIAYFLGIKYNTKSRELISTAAGNPWYNQKTIQQEKVLSSVK
ncbi:MAG: SIS domain-containing protein [Neisseriaceae bacterium]